MHPYESRSHLVWNLKEVKQRIAEQERMIAEYREREEHLRQMEERYHNLFDSSIEGLFLFEVVCNEHGNMVDCILRDANKSSAGYLRMPVDKTVGHLVSELFKQEDIYKFFRVCQKIMRKGRGRQFEVYLKSTDTWHLSWIFPVSKTYFGTGCIDITTRKHAEEELRKREAVLSQAGEMAQFGAWDIEVIHKDDISANPLNWCDEIYRIFGYEPGSVQVSYDLFSSHIHPDDKESVGNAIRGIISSRQPFHIIHRIIRHDGKERVVQENAEIHVNGKRPARIVGSIQDITERKHAEEELLRYQNHLEELVRNRTAELEERNRKLGEEIAEREKAEKEKERMESQLTQSQKIEALGRFSGGIAHDLNNILYPMIINTEMLLEEAEQGTVLYDLLKQNLDAAYRQRDLIKQILSFSRANIQKAIPVSIAPLLEKALDFLRSSLPSTIELKRSINAPMDTILGDPQQIRQVIINLCTNAAESLEPRRGVIEVSLMDVHLDSIPDEPGKGEGEFLVLQVRDTGPGMKKEVMERVFDPFFTTKDVGRGNGLGLSVSHGIVKKHGGFITVESEDGKGSLFTAYFPLTGQKETVNDSRHDHKKKKGDKLLLVDDEKIILVSLQRSLQRQGFDVKAVDNGDEAIELFRKNPDDFGLVITDLTMPKVTGIELGKRVKEIRPDIPIVVCTGYSDVISEDDVKRMGFSGLLMKPAGTSELKKAVRQAIKS